jgi:hypothetical protein
VVTPTQVVPLVLLTTFNSAQTWSARPKKSAILPSQNNRKRKNGLTLTICFFKAIVLLRALQALKVVLMTPRCSLHRWVFVRKKILWIPLCRPHRLSVLTGVGYIGESKLSGIAYTGESRLPGIGYTGESILNNVAYCTPASFLFGWTTQRKFVKIWNTHRVPLVRQGHDSPTERWKTGRRMTERRTLNDRMPNDRTPNDQTPNDRTPKDGTPNDRTPNDRTPNDRTPKDNRSKNT